VYESSVDSGSTDCRHNNTLAEADFDCTVDSGNIDIAACEWNQKSPEKSAARPWDVEKSIDHQEEVSCDAEL